MNSRKTSYILAVENDRVIIRNYDDYFSPRVITSVSDFSEFLFLEAARHGVRGRIRRPLVAGVG